MTNIDGNNNNNDDNNDNNNYYYDNTVLYTGVAFSATKVLLSIRALLTT